MTDNELIAEFMGCSKPPNPDFDYFWHGEFFKEYRAKWDKSWDWLMGVVEKIEKLTLPDENHFRVVISGSKNKTHCYIYRHHPGMSLGKKVSEGHGEYKLSSVYKAAVAFIKWFNSNHPQP